MLEQERRRGKHRRGVGDAAAGDVGRRAVHRLEDPRSCVGKARGGREAEAARDGGGEVGEDVAEHVLGGDHVEASRGDGKLHRRVVDEHVLDANVRIVRGQLVDHTPPEPRRLEHVRLVDRRERAAPAAGELERAPHEPLDLQRVVLARVEDRSVVAHPACAEVEAADELADDQHVDVAL